MERSCVGFLSLDLRANLELVETTLLEVLRLQHLVLAVRPLLVDVALVLELLGEMVQSLQPATPHTRTCQA